MSSIINHKVPAEKFLSIVEKSDLQKILGPSIKSVAGNIKRDGDLFAYDLEPSLRRSLSEIGVNLHPVPYLSHSHPFSKMLENHILYNVLPGHMDGNWVFSSIKKNKKEVFVQRKGKKTISILNRMICAKDFGRYDVETDSSVIRNFKFSNPDILPPKFLNFCKNKNVFIHDEVHHWGLTDMFFFLRQSKPKRFIFTVVYPVEILNGVMESQNPKMYTFRDSGSSKILFYPDGKASEGYEQEANLNWLFRASHFVNGDEIWTVKRIYSAYSHHCFEIIPGRYISDSKRVFNDFKTIDLTVLQKSRSLVFDHVPIKKEWVERVYIYLQCLKKPDMESAMAKLKQIMGDEMDVRVQMIFRKLTQRILREKKDEFQIFDISWSDKIKKAYLDIWPSWIVNGFETWKAKNLFDFLLSLKNLEVEVDCIEIRPTFRFENLKVIDCDHVEVEKAFNNLDSFQYGREGLMKVSSSNGYKVTIDVRFDSKRPANKDGKGYAINNPRVKDLGIPRLELNDEDWGRMSPFNQIAIGSFECPFLTVYDKCITCQLIIKKMQIRWRWFKLRLFVFNEGDKEEVDNIDDLISFRRNHLFGNSEVDDDFDFGFINFGQCKESIELEKKEKSGDDEIFDISELFEEVSRDEVETDPIDVELTNQSETTSDPYSQEPIDEDGGGRDEEQSYIDDQPNIFPKFMDKIKKIGRIWNCPLRMAERTIMDVEGDGDCFFHSFKGAFKIDLEVDELRARLARCLYETNEKEASQEILSGAWPEGWMISEWIKKNPKRSLCVHMIDNQGITVRIGPNEPAACLCKINEDHWGFFEEGISHDQGQAKRKEKFFNIDFDPQPFLDKVENFMCNQLKGRTALFFSKDKTIDYGHNQVNYLRHEWIEELEDLEERIGMNFNACLFQVYEDQAIIPFHKDNERCYGDDPIVTVNFGQALFEFDNGVSFEMDNGDCIIMEGDYLKKYRHRVKALCDGRFSFTFRLHRRSMNGSPIDEAFLIKMGKNSCLINCLSKALKKSPASISLKLIEKEKGLQEFIQSDRMATEFEIDLISKAMNCQIEVNDLEKESVMIFNESDEPRLIIKLELSDNHLTLFEKIDNKLKGEFDEESNNCDGEKDKRDKDSELSKEEELLNLLSLVEGIQNIKYAPNHERASILLKSFLNGSTGTVLNELFNNASRFFSWFPEKEEQGLILDIACRMGFPGSGKTKAIADLLKKVSVKFSVVTPRRVLTEEWKSRFNYKKGADFYTFEKFFSSNLSKKKVLVIDELTLFPPGYLDLLSYKVKRECPSLIIIALFDPLQARYDSASDRNFLENETDADKLIEGVKIDYMYSSLRFKSEMMSGLFEGIGPDLNRESIKFRVFNDVLSMKNDPIGKKVETILVSSFDETSLFTKPYEVMTFGQSQGITRRHVCILLSENSLLSDDNRWLVALSRASESICFLIKHLGGLSGFLASAENRMIKSVLTKKKVSEKRIKLMFRGEVNLIKRKILAGKSDEVDREDRLSGDPFLKGYIFLGQRENLIEPEVVEPIIPEEKAKTHLYLGEENFAQSINFDLIRAKEYREMRSGHMSTEQFIDNYEVVQYGQKRHTAGPLRFESIYPRHKSDDDLTFWMAVNKRLRFSDPMIERAKLSNAWGVGMILFENFMEKLDLKFNWDQNLFEECVNDFEEKKLEKSKATLANQSIRSDVDWSFDQIFLFMKSQLCTKYEKQFVDAKAGQTLACFQHLILVTFAPYCRYMEKVIRRQLPEEVYIHSNKNFNALNEWVKKFCDGSLSVESDYEAFDASQDQYILAFEVHLMRAMNLPNAIIDAYIELKLNLGCKLGKFAIMRFTGEFCTFLFNTLANMAFTFCRYEWKKSDPIAFAGDDMCALRNLRISNRFDSILDKVSLKAKVCVTDSPMFCGWRLSRFGIVKEPELIFNRFMVALERGKVHECIENYAIECSYAYSLGEKLYEVLKKEEQIEYHQQVVRFIIKNLSKIRGSVKELFQDD